MLFNSLAFAIFLPIVFALYWALPHRYRWIILLISSYYFYMSWNVKYVVLILGTTWVSYFCALMLEKAQSKRTKKAYLLLALFLCLGVVFVFKYFNFFFENINSILSAFAIPMHPITLKLLLPVGISFYTFQTLSYVIDVYRGDIPAEPHFGKYAAFISFFPQLVAGPIERAANLLPQVKQEHIFDYNQATYGLKLMAWGFFKKMVVADTLAVYVDAVYNNLNNYSGLSLIAATFFFTIQIYCDFSGYSDIAIGTAKLFGIELMQNFRSPYFSSSIKEFWSRWHISLSTWFRDYVYIPLGGNRCGRWKNRFNLFVTFLLSGLWHGANWTYIIWGAIHGGAQVIENFFVNIKRKTNRTQDTKWKKITTGGRVLLVFLFCNFAWIFFRAQSVSEAAYIFIHAFDGINNPINYIKAGYYSLNMGRYNFFQCVIMLCILGAYDYISLEKDIIISISSLPLWIRWAVYYLFVLLIIALMSSSSPNNQFIYFQF